MDIVVIENPSEYNIITDFKYATTNNFAKVAIYKNPVLMMHKDAFEKIKIASDITQKLGYKLKIFDAFRPFEAQQIFYNAFPGTNYVADPETGIATHVRGVAIDLTLIDSNNNELDMGTEFDSFEEKAHHTYYDLPKNILENRMMLLGIMVASGFEYYKYEWWHYQLPNAKNYKKYYNAELPYNMM